MSIYLAYDGSINGDWVSHYAVRMAARHAGRTLYLLHVEDRIRGATELQAKLERIASECEPVGVRCETLVHPLHGGVRTDLENLLLFLLQRLEAL